MTIIRQPSLFNIPESNDMKTTQNK